MRLRYLPTFFLIALCSLPASLQAATDPLTEQPNFDTFTLYWENDIFAGTDRDYTNGLKLSWSTPFLKNRDESELPDWSYSLLKSIPFAYDPTTEQAFSFSIGQNIYTPEDTSRSDLIIDDRPYAGQMYISFGVQNHCNNHKHSWELALGLIGPDSHADDLQDWLHDRTGSRPARGWPHQLKNEPTLDITYETKWRLYRRPLTARTSFDIIDHLGARFGNVAILVNTGFELRYGYHLPEDFGICPIRGGCEINSAFRNSHRPPNSIHLFMAVDARLVGRDIFLDGNTFASSHHVNKEPLVGDLTVGFAFRIGHFTSTYAYIFRTRQFEEQDRTADFGSITLGYNF